MVRPLRQAEIEACGNFSLIETFFDKVQKRKIRPHEMVAYSKMQHKILRASLASPTYDEVLQAAGQYENLESCKERIDAFRKEIASENNKEKRKKMEDELVSLELLYYQVLPADFVGMVLSDALQIAGSDIKKIDEEMLYSLAVMAKNNSNRPSDNIDGLFTAFNKSDIDRRSWAEYIEREKKKSAGRRRNR